MIAAFPVRRALTMADARRMITDPALPLALRQGTWLALKSATGRPVNMAVVFPASVPPSQREPVTTPIGRARAIDRLRAILAAGRMQGASE
jgi:hypothetical protein